MKVMGTSYVLLASVTVTATATPTKVVEGVSRTYVAVLVVAGLILILLGLVLSRRSLRGSRVSSTPATTTARAR